MDVFDSYFRRADLDQDGRISGQEAVAFFQGSNLPKNVLAQIWMHADQNRTGFLGRPEFYNALKLVTVAQSGRQLTPEMVKAALYGPAAAKIPAPQINPVSSPSAQINSSPAAQVNSLATPTPWLNSMAPPSSQMVGAAPTASQNLGFRGPHANTNLGVNQQFFPSTDNHFVRPPQATHASASLAMLGVNQGQSGAGTVAGPRLSSSSSSNLSSDSLGAGTSPTFTVGISQGSVRGVTPTAPGLPSKPQMPASSLSPPPQDPVLHLSPPASNNSKTLVISGKGFSSGSVFGGDAYTAISQSKLDASIPNFSASSMTNSSGTASAAAGSHNSIKIGQLDPSHHPMLSQGVGQLQQTHSLVKQNHLDTIQSTPVMTSSNVPVGPGVSASSQSQLPWPRITQSDIQNFTSVFVKVHEDRDGKITGEQARNLFLSWKVSRGLSHRGIPVSRPPLPVTGIRPPLQSPMPLQIDGLGQMLQPKSRVPTMEKPLVNQLAKEQSAMNSKFQGPTDADKNSISKFLVCSWKSRLLAI